MKVLFMGTPTFAVPALEALVNSHHEVVAVVTQPDRPQGRKMKLTPPPVKVCAFDHALPVLQPETFRKNDTLYEELAAFEADMWVVAAYGHILPQRFLDLPHLDCLNIHASLLPLYRGASPITWAVANGDQETGVSIMRMVKAMDAGPVYLQRAIPIGPSDTAGTMEARLAKLGGEAILEVLQAFEDDTVGEPTPQNEHAATYVSLLRKHDGLVDWGLSAQRLDWRIRGMSPWPGSYTYLEGKRVAILSAAPTEAPYSGHQGELLAAVRGAGLIVQAGEGLLAIRELCVEGRKPQTGEEFWNGLQGRSGLLFSGEK